MPKQIAKEPEHPTPPIHFTSRIWWTARTALLGLAPQVTPGSVRFDACLRGGACFVVLFCEQVSVPVCACLVRPCVCSRLTRAPVKHTCTRARAQLHAHAPLPATRYYYLLRQEAYSSARWNSQRDN